MLTSEINVIKFHAGDDAVTYMAFYAGRNRNREQFKRRCFGVAAVQKQRCCSWAIIAVDVMRGLKRRGRTNVVSRGEFDASATRLSSSAAAMIK